MALKIRRGTNAERIAGGGVVFAEGELIYVTDTDALYIGDGVTPGGILIADENSGNLSGFITADTTADNVKLEKDLNLNGNNIVGNGNINIDGNITATGNINIGDNTTEDTVTITAKVDSDITPTQDSAYNLGKSDKRWQNIYTSGLSVDGQIDAVAINANTVADNSTVMVNVVTNTFTGNLTGAVTGNVNGNVTGNVNGTLFGIVDGDVTGSVFADNSTLLVDGVAGVLRGDHYGSLYGSVKALNNGFTILNPGTDGTNASLVASVIGNVTGNVTGNLTGNVSGRLDGDVTGSVFADNSTLLVDGVNGFIPASVINGTITNNVNGTVSGTFTGNIFTNLIDSADSSEIVVTPAIRTLSDLTVEQTLNVGSGGIRLFNDGSANIGTLRSSILTDDGFGSVFFDTPLVEFSGGVAVLENSRFVKQLQIVWTDDNADNSLIIQQFIGDPDEDPQPEDFETYAKIDAVKAEFNIPVKFPNFTTIERNALTAEVGMVIFNTTDTKLQVCTVGGVSPTWINLH
jgi:hypothetical protein